MTIHQVLPPGQRDGRCLSRDLWRNCPREQIMNDPRAGYFFRDDFTDLPTGKYTVTQATTGTFALEDALGGVAAANSGATTAGQGPNIQKPGELFIPKAGSRIWFEAKFNVTALSTGPRLYVGLHETDTTIIAAGAMSGANFIGWQSLTGDGVLLFASEKADTGTTKAALTLAEGEDVKLGFFVDGVSSITQYLNGVKTGERILTANIPIVLMTPSLVCQSHGTTQPVAHPDWWECFQEDRS